jgi:hypothetical protein
MFAVHRTFGDQLTHRRAVAGVLARGEGPGVAVRVQMDHADIAVPDDVGERLHVRPGNRVVAAEKDGHGASLKHRADDVTDAGEACLNRTRDDGDVAEVDDVEVVKWVEPAHRMMPLAVSAAGVLGGA